jgi:DNA-3-methyladenine glycosylase I
LDGAQAGLSWITILKKRDNYYQAFDNFDPIKIADYDEEKVVSLMQDSGIIRNQAKIRAAIKNAREVLRIQDEHGSLAQYLWGFVGGAPIVNAWSSISELPSTSPESVAMSLSLKKRGFRFVGPTICYAFMQAVGMVNDHTLDCFRYSELTGLKI